MKRRPAAGHDAHRIAGGMGIDAEEGACASEFRGSLEALDAEGGEVAVAAPADEIGDVAGGDRRQRQAEMAVAEGEDDARVASGGRR